ncbi:MAG: hypothetical protein JWO13_1240 [Acidobacteriales bacterium]|nr:hypothetical protein [Terriglobales bacterium]
MEGHSSKRPISRILFLRSLAVTVIPLAGPLLAQSSATYPKVVASRAETRNGVSRYSLPIWSCSVWGLPCHMHYCMRGALLPHLFTLTEVFPLWRYILCGTFRKSALKPTPRTLSGTLLCGVRTFLPRSRTAWQSQRSRERQRPSSPPANFIIIDDSARVIAS